MPSDNPGPFLTDPNGQEHRLPAQTATIGRAMECDIVIASKSISRENTRIRTGGTPLVCGRFRFHQRDLPERRTDHHGDEPA